MKKADVWSLGVTLYCFAFNKLPFPIGNTEMEVIDLICNHEIDFSERAISKEL